MRPSHERHLYIVTTSLIGWAHTKTDPCSLSVMLINTAFSHSNEECSPYFLVTTHQTQARDDIDGLIQERRNSIANALEYVFLAPSLPIRSFICAPLIISYLNALKSICHCRNFVFNFIFGQCTEHIAPHYIVSRHIDSTILRLSNSWYTTTFTTSNTYIDYWSQADAVQSLNVVPSICHWYFVTLTLVCLVLIISRWWGWTNMHLLNCNIFVSVW